MIEGLGKSALHWQIHFEFVLYFKERKYNDLQVQNHASTSSHIHEYVENSSFCTVQCIFSKNRSADFQIYFKGFDKISVLTVKELQQFL